MSNIKLKHLLNEQWKPDPVQKDYMKISGNQVQASTAEKREKYIDKLAAKIYFAKGTFYDDEQLTADIFDRYIKDLYTYNLVNKALKKYTSSNLSAFLRSYLPLNIRLEIAGILMPRIPKSNWPYTILSIVPYEDFKYLGRTTFSTLFTGSNKTYNAIQANAATELINIYQDAWQTRDEELNQEFVDDLFTSTGIITSFIPMVGWAISSGIFAAHGIVQYNRGDVREAGLSWLFAAIPIFGKGLNLIAKMPSVAALGESGMAKLGQKLATSKNPVLSSIERKAFNEVWKNRYAVKNGLDDYVQASLYNDLKTSMVRSQLIKKYGPSMGILFKVADGSIKASRLPVYLTKIGIPLVGFNYSVDKYYELFAKYYSIPKAKEDLESLNKKIKSAPKDDFLTN